MPEDPGRSWFWWYALRMRKEPRTTGLFRWPPQLASRDLTLAHIDGDDGFHLAGVAIRTTTETPEYAAHNATVWAKGLTRTHSQRARLQSRQRLGTWR